MNEDIPISARDFFYTHVAPEEKGKSYQKIFHAHLHSKWRADPGKAPKFFNDPGSERILNFEPEFSNDWLLNEALKRISIIVDDRLASILKDVFIAKRYIKDAHAEALAKQGGHTGDIVFFYVGLSDACTEYAGLFEKFYDLCFELQEEEDAINEAFRIVEVTTKLGIGSQSVDMVVMRQRRDAALMEKRRELSIGFVVDAIRLALAQDEWSVQGNYIQLNPLLISSDEELGERALMMAFLTDRFILSHEVAHHLLGHTGNFRLPMDILEPLLAACEEKASGAELHIREFQADALALMMIAGLTRKGELIGSDRNRPELLADAAIGSLLTLTVLGHASCGMKASTRTHPSAQDRYDKCFEIIKASPNNEVALSVEKRIRKFGRILEVVRQSRQRYNETFRLFIPKNEDSANSSEHAVEAVFGFSALSYEICAIIGSEE